MTAKINKEKKMYTHKINKLELFLKCVENMQFVMSTNEIRFFRTKLSLRNLYSEEFFILLFVFLKMVF